MKLKITKEVFEFVEIPASAAEVYTIRIKKVRSKNIINNYNEKYDYNLKYGNIHS